MAHDLERLVREFEGRFGRPPEYAARAPGRVNLIGEHTDYNGGLVLPCAIDRDTVVLAARRNDGRIHVRSRELGADASFEAASPSRARGWIDYVQGVAFALHELGHDVPGLDVAISSEVPGGSGLSSSAALEVAVVTLFAEALGLHLSGEERARLAHRAENAFVGVPCGVMDQLASALGREGAALRIDCTSLEVKAVPVPEALVLLIVDSGVRHQLVGGDYNARRRECEAALAAAQGAGLVPASATTLRALGPAQLPALARALDPLHFRRARHVITENERVDEVCAAFECGDLARAGMALRAGMASLRDDFEVSTPEIDALCEVGDATPGVFGSRLTGAGFGGCTVHLVAREHAAAARSALEVGFASRYGKTAHAWIVRPSAGASVISLGLVR
jgi:galactokinase